MSLEPWKLRGELLVSCNCEVFCPCVLSLGKARPSEGDCHGWFGFHIEEGHSGEVQLGGLNMAVLVEVPGPMEQGVWTVARYIDERAGEPQAEALDGIFRGQRGGPISWWSIMIAQDLGIRRVPITFTSEGKHWSFNIPKVIDAEIEAVEGAGGDGTVRVTNTKYWMTPEVVVARNQRSRFRDFGRNRNWEGRSAEYASFSWTGP
jgi:hypothetical protein